MGLTKTYDLRLATAQYLVYAQRSAADLRTFWHGYAKVYYVDNARSSTLLKASLGATSYAK